MNLLDGLDVATESEMRSVNLAELRDILAKVPGVGKSKIAAILAAVEAYWNAGPVGGPMSIMPDPAYDDDPAIAAPMENQKTLPIPDEFDIDPIANATRLGAMAAARDLPVNSNPHPLHSMLGRAWDRGWQEEFAKPHPIPEERDCQQINIQ